jgi:hypothetical protein
MQDLIKPDFSNPAIPSWLRLSSWLKTPLDTRVMIQLTWGNWPQCLECLRATLIVSAAARDKLLHAATPIRGQSTAALFALLQSALHRPLLQVCHMNALIMAQT